MLLGVPCKENLRAVSRWSKHKTRWISQCPLACENQHEFLNLRGTYFPNLLIIFPGGDNESVSCLFVPHKEVAPLIWFHFKIGVARVFIFPPPPLITIIIWQCWWWQSGKSASTKHDLVNSVIHSTFFLYTLLLRRGYSLPIQSLPCLSPLISIQPHKILRQLAARNP